jgi:hypothetical protein
MKRKSGVKKAGKAKKRTTAARVAKNRPAKSAKKKTKTALATKKAPKTAKARSGAKPGVSAVALIDARIRDLDDWRGGVLAHLRRLINAADPDVVEEWKWGIPVWSHGGLICTGEVYKGHVKTTFAKGASLPDPSGLFNSSLEGNTRRAIDFHEGDRIDEQALKSLVRAAVALNLG